MELNIRQAQIVDLEAINTLINRSVNGLQNDDYETSLIRQAIELVSDLDILINSGKFFVAEHRDTIVGCGGYSLMPEEGDIAELKSYFVLPDFSRRGISTRLLKHSVSQCKQVGISSLMLSATLTGVPFYKRNGFSVVRKFDQKLSNGRNFRLVEMQRNIIP